MRGPQIGIHIGAPGRVRSEQISQCGENPGLVEDHPRLHAIAQRAHHDVGIVGETLRGIAVRPAARIFERLRQIPVIEGREWPNLRFQETVDETAVKIKSLRIRSPRSCSLNPRPRDREAIALHAQAAHDIQVFAIAMVVIAGNVPIVAVLDFVRRVREPIPDGFALAVFIPSALDLIRRRRSSPPEVLREGDGPSCCRFRALR